MTNPAARHESDHDPFVFISYSRKDSARVRWIEDNLAAAGISFFIDRRTPTGSRWETHLQDKIEHCTCLLVIWSQSSRKSSWVIREVTYADDRKKTIVPLRLDYVPPPEDFRHLNVADLHQWRGSSEYPEWHKVLKAVEASGLTRQQVSLPRASHLRAALRDAAAVVPNQLHNQQSEVTTDVMEVSSRRQLFEAVAELLHHGFQIIETDIEGALLEKTRKLSWPRWILISVPLLQRLPQTERIRVTLIERP